MYLFLVPEFADLSLISETNYQYLLIASDENPNSTLRKEMLATHRGYRKPSNNRPCLQQFQSTSLLDMIVNHPSNSLATCNNSKARSICCTQTPDPTSSLKYNRQRFLPSPLLKGKYKQFLPSPINGIDFNHLLHLTLLKG